MIGYIELTDARDGMKRFLPVGFLLNCQVSENDSIGCTLIPSTPGLDEVWVQEPYENVRGILASICEKIAAQQHAAAASRSGLALPMGFPRNGS